MPALYRRLQFPLSLVHMHRVRLPLLSRRPHVFNDTSANDQPQRIYSTISSALQRRRSPGTPGSAARSVFPPSTFYPAITAWDLPSGTFPPPRRTCRADGRPAGRHGPGPQVAARLSGCRDKVTAALDSCLTIHTIIVFCRRYTVCSQAELGGGPGYVACTQAEDVACSSCDGPFTQPRDRVREGGPSMRSPALHRITAITRRVSW